MEQMNNALLTMLTTSAGQSDLTKNVGKGDGSDEFQKLLDQKTNQATKPESSNTTSKPKDKAPVENKDANTEKKDGPIQEDAQTTAKRMMQSGLVVVDPAMFQMVQVETAVMVEGEQTILPQDALVTEEVVVQPQQTMMTQENPGQAMGEQLQGEANAQAKQGEVVVTQETVQTEMPVEAKSQLGQNAQVEGRKADTSTEAEVVDVEQAPQRVFREVETVPVKVGETYQTEEPDVAKQIDTQLGQALSKGETHVRIQLTPEHLGNVTVDVTQNSDGILRIAISAHSSETRGLLERHLNNLQMMLSNRTQQAVQVEVQRQEESQQGQNQENPYDGHNGSNREEQEERRQRHNEQREQAATQDFAQQLRLGLIPEA
ncbi:MAG: hypothetical protein HFE99_08190 [Ruminiclostridium sp.]|jgi:flagellar hook-length control protein FliK|nr:hypothetical protein [Ruminiclostridium sp.]